MFPPICKKNLVNGDVNPDIIFLDIDLPVKNGMETLIEIRKVSNHFVPF
ncbi:hypothetical protein [Dyadobacter sp. MSC1_007]|jgi:DNA-binding response OmpR family regulator|nr:hypothetical protein [Dyadobacter sp. MSC1_007]